MSLLKHPYRSLVATGFALLLPLPGSLLAFAPGRLHAQTPSASQPVTHKGVEGTWQGTLQVGQNLRLQLKISGTPTGALAASFYSIDQGGQRIPVNTVTFQGGTLICTISMLDGSYQGKLSEDAKTLVGTWKQGSGGSLPLTLDRANAETAWEVPKPTPATSPMASDMHPTFDIATIKPNDSGKPGHGFTLRGDHILTINTSVVDLLSFAYGISSKQIVGGPEWMSTQKFDIDGKADIPGLPSIKQSGEMLQKLLAERFQLKFHRDTRELSAYVLTVTPGGPKLEKSDAGPNAIPGLFFSQLGNLHVHNATLAEFAGVMQSTVFERPVIDQTGITGRYSFNLKWQPDETQFSSMGVKVPPPTDAADAPPPLFTAIQEQVGLKLTAGKPQVPVLVIDGIDQPSPN